MEAGARGAGDDESRMLRPARRVARRTARRTARRHAAYYYRKLTGEDAMAMNDGETMEAGARGAGDDESRMLRPARRVARRTARRTARRHAAYYYRKLTGEEPEPEPRKEQDTQTDIVHVQLAKVKDQKTGQAGGCVAAGFVEVVMDTHE